MPMATGIPLLWSTGLGLGFIFCVCVLNIGLFPKMWWRGRKGSESPFLSPWMNLSLQIQVCKMPTFYFSITELSFVFRSCPYGMMEAWFHSIFSLSLGFTEVWGDLECPKGGALVLVSRVRIALRWDIHHPLKPLVAGPHRVLLRRPPLAVPFLLLSPRTFWHTQPSVSCTRAVPGWGNSMGCLWLLTLTFIGIILFLTLFLKGTSQGAGSTNMYTPFTFLLSLLSASSSTLGQKPNLCSFCSCSNFQARPALRKENKKKNP